MRKLSDSRDFQHFFPLIRKFTEIHIFPQERILRWPFYDLLNEYSNDWASLIFEVLWKNKIIEQLFTSTILLQHKLWTELSVALWPGIENEHTGNFKLFHTYHTWEKHPKRTELHVDVLHSYVRHVINDLSELNLNKYASLSKVITTAPVSQLDKTKANDTDIEFVVFLEKCNRIFNCKINKKPYWLLWLFYL